MTLCDCKHINIIRCKFTTLSLSVYCQNAYMHVYTYVHKIQINGIEWKHPCQQIQIHILPFVNKFMTFLSRLGSEGVILEFLWTFFAVARNVTRQMLWGNRKSHTTRIHAQRNNSIWTPLLISPWVKNHGEHLQDTKTKASSALKNIV